jgi:hypothetical protein
MLALRLAWRIQRWEMTLLVGSALALTAAALILPATQEGSGDARMIVLFLTLAGPILIGSTLGVGLVAAEIEHGTAQVAWSLAPSRARWLLTRAWPLAAVGVMVCLVLGAATARLMDETSPSNIFMAAMRGPIVALHLLSALAIGTLVGAILRRVLPSLLVAIAVNAGILILLSSAVQPWMEERSTLVRVEERSSDPVIAVLEYETVSISSTGELVLTEPECDTQANCMAATAELTHAVLIVPGSAYLPLLGYAAAASFIIVVIAGAATAGLITRFGPD